MTAWILTCLPLRVLCGIHIRDSNLTQVPCIGFGGVAVRSSQCDTRYVHSPRIDTHPTPGIDGMSPQHYVEVHVSAMDDTSCGSVVLSSRSDRMCTRISHVISQAQRCHTRCAVHGCIRAYTSWTKALKHTIRLQPSTAGHM